MLESILLPLLLKLPLMFPNLAAGYYQMQHKIHESNALYVGGYLLFIWHNIETKDWFQILYFSILWIFAVKGVKKHMDELQAQGVKINIRTVLLNLPLVKKLRERLRIRH